MKTKIKTISPDQNIIEHESGLKTKFISDRKGIDSCDVCVYKSNDECFDSENPCTYYGRKDKKDGHYIKLDNHENN